jgi:hypothetical protein
VIRTFATTLKSELGRAAIGLSAPFDPQLPAMRNACHAKHAAFFVPAAIFFACAADTGDVAKTAQPVTQASTASSAPVPSSSASSTGNSAVYAPSSSSDDAGTSGGGGQTSSESSSATDASAPEDASTTEEASTLEDGSALDDASTLEAAAPCTTCAVELTYESDNATKTGGAAFEIEIVNTGTTALDLSTVSVKYYFVADGLSGFIFDVYTSYINNAASSAYAAVGVAAVSGAVSAFTPSTATADSVLTIRFTGAAGSVPVGDFFYFKGELHDPSYSMEFTQTNDYSYNAMDDTKLTANMHIVVDIGATIAWGTAP